MTAASAASGGVALGFEGVRRAYEQSLGELCARSPLAALDEAPAR